MQRNARLGIAALSVGWFLLTTSLVLAQERMTLQGHSSYGNRSRPVEEFGGGLLVEAGFDGGTEPLVDGPFLQAAGF